ncbi:MAG: small multi-drug export protein [Methanoregulaceae archaeon]|nr:small multi-drug export protein [Methanoregulaceae archaeon]
MVIYETGAAGQHKTYRNSHATSSEYHMRPPSFRIAALELAPSRPVHLPERIIRIILPFAIGLCYYIPLLAVISYEQWLILGGLMLAYIFPPAGKESVIPLGIAVGFPWWLMAFTIILMDLLTGLFMALNFDVALKIPGLGRWIRKFIANGEQFFSRRPWLERFYFAGVVMFVMFPLQGSGGIGATLVGRMIGLSPARVLMAIAIGTTIGCTTIALGAEFVKELILANPVLGLAVAVLIIGTLAVIYLMYRRKMMARASLSG